MGWANESIEPEQRDAVDAVAARLTAAPAPMRVVSSPLAQARETAAPLAAALSVDPETDARLGELHKILGRGSQSQQWLGRSLVHRQARGLLPHEAAEPDAIHEH